MYDFESVSVSSFEAASLASKLTEKATDGWDVVAIVPAGSDVVAYLRRARDGAGSAAPSITDGTSNTIELDSASSEPSAADLLTPTSVSSQPAVSSVDDTSPTSASDNGGTGWGAGGDAQSPAATASSWSGSAQQAAAPATPSVPPGWYADPAGRYELRYWDGNSWTEHVSRQGQQYTDPPVA
jgi:hypothetical protein